MNENTFLENLAAAIQKDITKILNTMATKDDIQQLRKEMLGEIEGSAKSIRAQMVTKEDLRNYATISDVRGIVSDAKNEILKEIDRLRGRTGRIEEKVGISPARA